VATPTKVPQAPLRMTKGRNATLAANTKVDFITKGILRSSHSEAAG
jgi:hypothetical protein